MIKVLFVCTGNICRSPMAEAVFKDLVAREGLEDRFYIDSVGTECYYLNSPAHPGTQRVLAEHGIEYHSISRRVTFADLREADYIMAMDHDNLSDLKAMGRDVSLDGRLHLLLSFAKDEPGTEIPDPYYAGNFEEIYRLIEVGCWGLLRHIRYEHRI
jgi:protein-tyrosine phosphatase